MTLKRISYILIAIGLVFTLMLGYLEVLPRISQYRMMAGWQSKSAHVEEKKLLKVEKKGPDKNQLGVIMIPKIDVKQVVLYDATVSNLALGPSLIKETAYPGTKGNAAIAGHRVSHGFPFRNIHKLKRGDKVIFANSSGQVIYRVQKKFQVVPSNVSVLKKTPYPRLTLLSCSPPFSAKYRLTIIATAKDYKK